MAPWGSRPAGDRRRRKWFKFRCTSCGWSGKKGASLRYCPRCKEQTVVRVDPPKDKK
jgi:predicted RNA-binding Zn-ribbon protein involved in translation (DUF1610 family)